MTRRARADWPVVVASWLLLVSALSLVTAGSLYSDSLATAGLRRALAASPPAERSIDVRTRIQPGRLAAADTVVRPELERVIAPVGGEVSRVLRSGPYAPTLADPATVKDLILFASYEGLDRHATLADGRWAAAGRNPVEATVSDAAAAALGVRTGDRLDLVDRLAGGRVEVVITGTWRATAADPWWLDDHLGLTGTEPGVAYRTQGPLVVASADLENGLLGDTLDAEWRSVPDVAGFRPDTLDTVAADVALLPAVINAGLPGSNQATVATKLPAILAEVSRSQLVMRAGILLLLVQFGVVAAYAIVLVAALLVDRRRAETALLRARGAGSGRLVALALGEAVLLVVPAVVVAPWLAVPLVALVQLNPALAPVGLTLPAPGLATVELAVVAGFVSLLALTLPTVAAAWTPGGRLAAGRPAGRTLPQRLGLDLAVVVIAAVGLLQLRLYGAPLTRNARGVLGIDPLLVAAPAIGLVAGAVLAIRFVPRAAELAEGLAVRTRGLTVSIAGRGLARRPLRSTRIALLLVLAAGLGTYASAHAATWSRSQGDQAAYAAAADVRLTPGPESTVPGLAIASALRQIPGVTDVSPVTRASAGFGPSLRDVALLGVDGTTMASAVRLRDDGTQGATLAGLGALASRRPPVGGIPLPAGTSKLGVVVAGAFEDFDQPDGPIVATSVTIGLVVADTFGRFLHVDSAVHDLTAAEGRVEIPLATGLEAAADPGLRLVALSAEIKFSGIGFGVASGHADLLRFEIAGSDGTWATFDDAAATGRETLNVDASGDIPYQAPTGNPGRIQIEGAYSAGSAIYRRSYLPQTTAPIPALVDASFLERTSASIGESVTATVQSVRVTLDLVARLDSFPPLDPGVPFAIVDRQALDLARLGGRVTLPGTDEWWLAVAPGSSGAVAQAVTTGPIAATGVLDRAALLSSLEADPLGLGVIGILGLGSVAALLFAAIGFLVNATVSTADRLGELALLKALGLSPRQLLGALAIEHGSLLAVSLVAGTGLGLLLAWLVLPFATLTPAGEPPVPAPVIVVPPDAVWPVLGLAVALIVATLVIVRRQLPAARTSAVLRAKDE